MMVAYIPAETISVYNTVPIHKRMDNMGLIFSKYMDRWEYKEGRLKLDTGEFLKIFDNKTPSQQVKNLLQELQARMEALKTVYENELRYRFYRFDKHTDWRLAVGMGSAHVLEISMTFDFIYGIPVIPGSSLKGMTRAYAEAEGIEKDTIKDIFGTNDSEGKIIFFDAYPVSDFKLKVDIMNPHYPDYYSGNEKWPTDYQSPIPIPFLTVEDTKFRFCIAYRKDELSDDLGQKAKTWLEEGLANMGIGAKTAVGYGYFE